MKRRSPFDDRDRARESGRLGGHARAAKLRAARGGPVDPLPLTFLDFLDATGHGGPSRATWRVFWKAADGLPLDDAELPVFRRHTARETAPTAPATECWLPAGRRGGKTENMVTRATWRAISRPWRQLLSRGEIGVIPLIASDRDQARNSLSYLKGLAALPLVAPFVARRLRDAVEFRTGAVVKVQTASWASVRGYTMLDVILEECAFYPVEGSAHPDEDILTAVRPALLTVPGARVYGISSPWARRGVLWEAFEAHWGRDSDVLVFSADTRSLNPTADARKIEREFERDPIAAASEYGRDGRVSFRTDVESFVSREAVDAVTVPGRLELPPQRGVRYVAFVDPSGGSQDAMTLAIAHHEGGRAVLDLVRERRPPFSPDDVVREYADVLSSYGLSRVTGDRYGGEWPAERFRVYGIAYTPAERTKSELYAALLPVLNASRLELLDLPRLRAQLLGLERRVARGGRDSIDHLLGGHDDLANAVAGALLTVAPARVPLVILDGGPGDLDEPGASLDDTAFDAEAIQRLPAGCWIPGRDPLPLADESRRAVSPEPPAADDDAAPEAPGGGLVVL